MIQGYRSGLGGRGLVSDGRGLCGPTPHTAGPRPITAPLQHTSPLLILMLLTALRGRARSRSYMRARR